MCYNLLSLQILLIIIIFYYSGIISFSFSAHALKKHMDTLRTGFGRMNKPPPSGSAPKKLSSRNQYIKAAMSFLGPYMRHRPSHSNLEDSDEDYVCLDNSGSNSEEDDVPLSSLNTGHKKQTVKADVHREDISENSNDAEIVNAKPVSEAMPDLDGPTQQNIPNEGAEVAHDSDVKIISDNLNTREVSVKHSASKKNTSQVVKRTRTPAKRALIPEESEAAIFMRSMNSTLQNIGNKLLVERPEVKKVRDEVTVCVESLEVKLRSIKKRENRLRLIDGIERLAFKYILDDCLESESIPCQRSTQSVSNYSHSQYMPSVQNISPPRNVILGHGQGNVNQPNLSTALNQLLSGANLNTLTCNLTGLQNQSTQQQVMVPVTYTQMSNQGIGNTTLVNETSNFQTKTNTATTTTLSGPVMTTVYVSNETTNADNSGTSILTSSAETATSQMLSTIQTPLNF